MVAGRRGTILSGGIEIVYAQHEAGFLDNLGLLDSVAQIAVAEPVLPRAVKDDSSGTT